RRPHQQREFVLVEREIDALQRLQLANARTRRNRRGRVSSSRDARSPGDCLMSLGSLTSARKGAAIAAPQGQLDIDSALLIDEDDEDISDILRAILGQTTLTTEAFS
ncbi:hypothetical protein, partial [Rhodomicrobium vannielii]|uniref:hypothetical protein n=1 Tax=Rhodomicrobium vannielii TaxID=1069 RepID=UPI001AEE805F